MKQDVIKVTDQIYIDSNVVAKKIVLDLLERLTVHNRVRLCDLDGSASCTSVSVSDKGVMRNTWEESYHNGDIWDYKSTLITNDENDVKIVQTAINLIKIYKL